jgi:PhnB protein
MKKKAISKRPAAPKRSRASKKPPASRPQLAVPTGPSATPYIVVNDAARAIDFYQRAFGAIEVVRLTAADGRVAHCEIKIGDASIMIADEWKDVGASSPAALGGCPVIIHLEVDDVDALARRAIAAGAKVIFPVQDQFYGERAGRLQDPFGHMWLLSMKLENVSDREMRKRERAYFKRTGGK